VYAPVEVQRARLRERNKLSDDEIALRLNSQMPIDEKVERATHVLLNETTVAELRRQVKVLVALFD
jgi:dephospho-CoA kinase